MANKIYLRALEPSDIDRVYQWHNDPGLYETLLGQRYFVSRCTVEKWLAQKMAFSNTEISLAICITETDEHIGNIYLKDIDHANRHGFLHILIGSPNHRNKGYGTDAMRQLLDYAFDTMGLERVGLHVLADKDSSIKFYEKSGFIKEGTLRRHVFKNGSFRDVITMGLCRDDYSKLRNG